MHCEELARPGRWGASRAKNVDVRVIAATNKDLAKRMEGKRFREDLFYRLNVVPIKLPALRDRRGDIPLLAESFVTAANARYGLSAKITKSGMRAMEEYAWPGNVRQLQHLIERLAILAPQYRIDEEAVLDAIQSMSSRDGQGGEGRLCPGVDPKGRSLVCGKYLVYYRADSRRVAVRA